MNLSAYIYIRSVSKISDEKTGGWLSCYMINMVVKLSIVVLTSLII